MTETVNLYDAPRISRRLSYSEDGSGAMLRHHRKKGLIRSFAGEDGQFMLWELVPDYPGM